MSGHHRDMATFFQVELQPRAHEKHMRHVSEDWSGITDPVERKKLQNRLNKRISRQRKRKQLVAKRCYVSESSGSSPSSTGISASDTTACSSERDAGEETAEDPFEGVEATFSHTTAETVTTQRAILGRFAENALVSYTLADPRADYRLKLIQLNVINGLTRNASTLGFQFDWLICEVLSPFGDAGVSPSPNPITLAGPGYLPGNMAPTDMQLATKHHPWVDLFPLPTMRDNLLIASEVLSPEQEQELYDDVLESGGGREEWAGLVVWGEPSDVRNWEISVPFMRKWGWTLKGCPDIVKATNAWRRERGEESIELAWSRLESDS